MTAFLRYIMDLLLLMDHAAQSFATEGYLDSHGIPHPESLISRRLTSAHHTRLRPRLRREIPRRPASENRSPTPAGQVDRHVRQVRGRNISRRIHLVSQAAEGTAMHTNGLRYHSATKLTDSDSNTKSRRDFLQGLRQCHSGLTPF